MTDTDHALLLSMWRTLVPYIVGYAGALAAKHGLDIDDASLESLLTLAFGTVYYTASRWLEQHAGKRWGWLLGYPKGPEYARGKHRAAATDGDA